MFGNNFYNGVNNERIYRETKADLTDSTTSTQMSNRNYEEEITMENTTYNEQSTNSTRHILQITSLLLCRYLCNLTKCAISA